MLDHTGEPMTLLRPHSINMEIIRPSGSAFKFRIKGVGAE